MTRSILIVDDDARILTALSEALSDEATDVRTAASAEAALAAIGASCPDVVLSDLRMPGMDGIELLRLLRERVGSTDVVIMTAYQDLPTVATAMREGAQDFLVKPLDLHQLRRLLDRIFEDRKTRERALRARPTSSSSGSAASILPEALGPLGQFGSHGVKEFSTETPDRLLRTARFGLQRVHRYHVVVRVAVDEPVKGIDPGRSRPSPAAGPR